jgi:hypothetical protein
MRQHRRQHMVMPARVFADFIVSHTEFRFAFFEALFHSPPKTTEPDQGAPGGARRGMTDGIGIRRLGASCPLDHEPDRAVRQAALTQRHALPGTRILERPLRPFCHLPAIPAGSGPWRRHRRHQARCVVRGYHHALPSDVSLIRGALILGPGTLEPATRLGRDRHPCRESDTRINGVQKGGALAIEAVSHHLLERQETRMRHSL